MGKVHALAYAGMPGAKVVGVYSREAARAAAVAAMCGAEACTDAALLIHDPDIDAIDVCLPTPVHAEHVIAALRAGKDVFCETPFALCLRDAYEMQEAAREANRLLQVGLLMRSVAAHQHVKHATDSGSHGGLLSVAAWRLGSYLQPESPGRKAHYGEPSIELMTFDFDFIHWLMGRPTTLSASAVQTANGPGELSTLLNYEDGRHATVTASVLMPVGFPFTAGFRALFERAVFEHSSVFDKDGPPTSHFTMADESGPRPVAIQDRNPYQVELQRFIECVAGVADPGLLAVEQAIEALVFSTATRMSLEDKRPIEID